jgi:hypothetical protein
MSGEPLGLRRLVVLHASQTNHYCRMRYQKTDRELNFELQNSRPPIGRQGHSSLENEHVVANERARDSTAILVSARPIAGSTLVIHADPPSAIFSHYLPTRTPERWRLTDS